MKIKRIMSGILAVMLAASLCACENSEESSEANNSTDTTAVTVATTTAPTPETTAPETTTTAATTEAEETTTTTTEQVTTVTTTTKPKPVTTTTKKVTTTKVTTTTKQVTTTEKPESEEVKLDVSPVKAKYYSTASAFACVEMIANYFGYTAKQDDVIKYLDIDDDIYKKNGRTYIGYPDFHFIGDPSKKSAIGSTGAPIQLATQSYFEDNGINLNIIVPSKIPFWEFKVAIIEENFLILWIADDVDKCTDYYVKDDLADVVAIWPDNMTCMLLVAASDDYVTLYDPLSNKTIKMDENEYDKRACHYSINIRKE